jgi:hypothetical protein
MRDGKIRALTSTAEPTWSSSQQRLLEVLKQEDHRKKSPAEICRLAGYKTRTPWQKALEDEQFIAAVEAIGVTIRRHHRTPHQEVSLATNIEEELAQDIWDIRRLKGDYPKHVPPAAYEVDFSWIVNPLLREQIKHYFRLRLPRWEAYTFKSALLHMKPFLMGLPTAIHVGTLQRSHIETLLPEIGQSSDIQANRCLREMQIMLAYMATSPAWAGRPSTTALSYLERRYSPQTRDTPTSHSTRCP